MDARKDGWIIDRWIDEACDVDTGLGTSPLRCLTLCSAAKTAKKAYNMNKTSTSIGSFALHPEAFGFAWQAILLNGITSACRGCEWDAYMCMLASLDARKGNLVKHESAQKRRRGESVQKHSSCAETKMSIHGTNGSIYDLTWANEGTLSVSSPAVMTKQAIEEAPDPIATAIQ
jgi:hypothetical protein